MLAELPRFPEWSGDSDRDAIIHDLFTEHCADLVRLAYLIVGDRDIAEDSVHEAFIAVYRNWNTLRGRSSLGAELRAAVISQCRTAQRGRSRSRRIDGDAIANDQALRILAVLRRMPERQREVIVCRYHLDLSEAQTAALLELEIGTVNRHAQRALQRLQRDTDLIDVGAHVKWGLRSVADGIQVSAADVAGLESEFIVGRASRPQRRAWRNQNWLVAACAVLALALAVAALSIVGGERGVPAIPALLDSASRPLTAADLVGVWRIDDDPRPIVWVLHANGTMAIWSSPEDLRRGRSEPGFAYSVKGDVLMLRWRDTCTASWALSVLAPGRLRADLETGASCGPRSPGWLSSVLTRVLPTAAGELRPKYIGGTLDRIQWLSSLTGTWLLSGTGRLLAVDDAGHYVVSDDAGTVDDKGRVPLVEEGTVTLAADGSAVFTAKGEHCTRTYASVRSDYATMDARLAQDSCGRLGGAADTWIRLN
jgi:RNA polymerase sigma factor (sigma-70 family)